MRILYVIHYAGSPEHGMEFRPYYLAREWVRAGHSVRILAASYSHLRAKQPDMHFESGSKPVIENISGIQYQWFRTPEYQGNGFGRSINIASFLWSVARSARSIVREFAPDVVIASSTYPMDIWVARRVGALSGAKVVFEVHDLWPLTLTEIGGLSRWHPFVLICGIAEKIAYSRSDYVVSMLPKISRHAISRGMQAGKLRIIPNGISPEEWEGDRQDVAVAIRDEILSARSQGRFIVGYAGSHGRANALDTLLNAAEQLRDSPVSFFLVGNGHEKERLVRAAAERRLSNVTFFDSIPKAQIPAFLKLIDVAYIGWEPLPIYRFGIAPNKLMDYMMAECVILHSVSAGNDPVADAGCGLTVLPGDPNAVAEGLLRLAALPADKRREMGRRGRGFVLANHAYPVLAQRFLIDLGREAH